ncbi:MAG TPA: heme exporter protein CcmD [Thiohalobacter sp.]|nr:heme exporter protein CcmD [Thiohalobacter sp.]
MMDIKAFIEMGGYGTYVWSAYGIAALVLAVTALAPLRQHRKLIARLARRARRAGSRTQ